VKAKVLIFKELAVFQGQVATTDAGSLKSLQFSN